MLILLHELQHRLIVVQHHARFFAVDHLQLVHLHVALLLKFLSFSLCILFLAFCFRFFFFKTNFWRIDSAIVSHVYIYLYEHIRTNSFNNQFSSSFLYCIIIIIILLHIFFSRVNFLYVV